MTPMDPSGTFLAEARELLNQLEGALLALEERPSDRPLIDMVFRALHTLKGSGGMFGPPALADFAHEVETAFERIRQGQEVLTPAFMTALLASRDHLELLLEHPDKVDPEVTRALRASLAGNKPAAALPTIAKGAEPAASSEAMESVQRRWRIAMTLSPASLTFGINPLSLLAELRELGACEVSVRTDAVPPLPVLDPTTLYLSWEILLTTAHPRSAIEDVFIFAAEEGAIAIEEIAEPQTQENEAGKPALPSSQVPGPAAQPVPRAGVAKAVPDKPEEARGSADKAEASIRVAASRLDALLDQVGELVIAQARLTALSNHHGDPQLTSVVEEIERLSAELRESTMGMRMLPIGTLFSRYRRVVRDLSQEMGKDVVLTTSGEATELDKTMIERLSDPLVHLIRNAVDHGIENVEARLAAGKRRSGSLHLEARQAGAEVLIGIRDDGAGLDRAKIRSKAVSRGLIAADAVLPDREIDQLILLPGFSTAEVVSNLSGRGVGMDVVKRTIEDLRGSVDIASSPGQGTTITLRLPLTLAIIDGLLVRVGNGMCVIPLSAVEECVELAAAEHKGSSGRNFLNIRDTLVPFLRLHEVFGLELGEEHGEKVVIVSSEHGRVGLVLDQVVGQHQTVIKSLSPLHRGISGLAGATILGDGRVALILDTASLIQSVEMLPVSPLAA